MAGTNGFDIAGGVTQEFLTSLTTALFDNAVNDGTLQNPITVDFFGTETTVTLSDPGLEICPDPDPDTGWSSALDLHVSLAVESPSISGTLHVKTNVEEINLATVEQADYVEASGDADSYADCGALPGSLPSTGCTLMAWVWLQSSARQGVLTLVDGDSQTELGLYLGQSLPSLWYGGKSYDYTPGEYSPQFPMGQWRHLAAVIGPGESSGSQVTFYLDGQPQATVAMASFGGAGGTLRVGPADGTAGASAFDGRITGVSVWQTPLTAAQVQLLMNADLSGYGLDPSLGAIGYWTFDSSSPRNLLDPDGPAVTTAGASVSFVQEEDPGYQSYLYFATDDPDDVFEVSNTFPSQYQQKVDDFVTGILAQKVQQGAIAMSSGSSGQAAAGDGDGDEPAASAAPSFLHLVTETSGSGWSGPDQLLFLVMMDNGIPPSFDYQSTFAGDGTLAVPDGDNLSLAAWDYFVFSLLGSKLEDQGWSVTVTPDPGKLVATHKSMRLTLTIADGLGLAARIQAEFGVLADDVWKVDALTTLTFTVLPSEGGETLIEMKTADTSVSMIANQSSPVVISFEVIAALAPALGVICLLFASIWRAIVMSILYKKIGGIDKLITVADGGRFELSEIVFEDGVAVYGYLSPPGPVITAISATSGEPGDTLTITGQGFVDTGGQNLLQAAEIGGQTVAVTAPSGTSQEATTTAQVPLGGTGSPTPVRVQNASGNWSNSGGDFTVLGKVAPSDVELVDTEGVAGDAIRISGKGFTGTTAVAFGTASAAGYTVNSDTSLTATVPLFPQEGPVTVTNNVDSASSSNDFEPIPAPVITSVDPDEGTPGTVLTVSGSGFIERGGQPVQVSFTRDSTGTFWTAGVDATLLSESSLQVTVPKGAVPGFLRVESASGTSGAYPFTVDNDDKPVVASFDPAEGKTGTQFQVTGSNFTGATRVRIGGQACSQLTLDPQSGDTLMTAVVAPQTDTGAVTVTNSAGTSEPSAQDFEIIPKPSVLSIAPSSGTPGEEVTIQGKDFVDSSGDSVLDPDNGVVIGGQNAAVASVTGTPSASQAVAAVPEGATGIATPITVNTVGGSSTSPQKFTALGAGQPQIDQVSPASAAARARLTLTGSNFTGTSRVTLGSTAMTFAVLSDTEMTADVPRQAAAGDYTLTVKNANGKSATAPFTVTS